MKQGHLGVARRLGIFSALSIVVVVVYLSLSDHSVKKMDIAGENVRAEAIRAEAIRKKSAQENKDSHSPKKVLTSEEIESGKW